MRFALKMTWRELRSSWRRLVFFTVCLSLGVGAIVTLRSAIQSVNAYTSRESKAINGGDISLRNSHGWTAEALAEVDKMAAAAGVDTRTETIEVPTMLRPTGDRDATAKMVELKGVEPAYPLYGTLKLTDDEPYSYDLLANRGALISPSLAAQLDIGVGDVVRLGDGEFTIRGLIAQEPDSGLGGFSLGSRVIVALDDLKQAGILGFTARTRQTVLLRVPDAAYGPLLTTFKRQMRDDYVTVRGYREAESRLNDQLARAADYLSLVGLAILVLGGVGIWSVTRVYIGQRWRSIAVLKCLGCTNAQAVGAYTLQMAAIGLLGSIGGILLAALSLALLRGYLSGGALASVWVGLTWSAVGQGVAVGELVALLFSLTPLLGIRDVRPNLVLRSEDPRGRGRWNFVRVVASALVLGGLAGVAAWQAGSVRVGVIFLVSLLVVGFACAAVGELLVRGVRAARRLPVFSLRYAVMGLNRPGNQTRAILIGIGLGVFFLVGTAGVESTLQGALDRELTADLPDMYLVDVQQDQRSGVEEILEQKTGAAPALVPTIRARIAALRGKPVNLEAIEDPRERGRLGREYTLTTRPELDSNETVVAGDWWSADPAPTPEVSIEESLSRDFGLRVGDTMAFDVQGEKITTRIANVRHVDWQNSRLGFMIVLRPGSLGDVPLVYIGAVKGPEGAADRGRLARAISDSYPNVSIIDARDVIAMVTRVLNAISRAITIIGSIVLIAGILILTGAIAMSRYVREYETAVMKTLGARWGTLLGVMLAENALLGLLAGLIGSALGVGLAWVVSTQVFDLPMVYAPAQPIAGVVGAVVLTSVVGMISSADLLVVKPLPVLRRADA